MAIGDGGKTSRAVVVAVAAEMVYQLTGCNMSSPQTAQLNAAARAPTIKKWVALTNVESIAWTIFLCLLDMSLWPLVGGAIAIVTMHMKYDHAIKKGLEEGGEPTENYQNPGAPAQPHPSPRAGRVVG